MKKLFFLILLSFPAMCFSQSLGSLNIYSENGDKFYLYLDGKKQNDTAYSNIRIQDLPDLYYSVKIIFADNAIAPVSKNNIYISDADDIMRDAIYRLRRDKSGKARLGFYSLLHVQENFVPTRGMYVFHFNEPSVSETMPVPEERTGEVASDSVQSFGSLTVVSLNGDKFYLLLNGVKQNDVAQSSIRVQQLSDLRYNVKIVFKDAKILPVVKNSLFISDEDDNLMDAIYRLRRDPIKRPKLNFFAMKEVQKNFIPPPGMAVYDFGKPAAMVNAVSKKTNSSNVKLQVENKNAENKILKSPATKNTSAKLSETNADKNARPAAKNKTALSSAAPAADKSLPENKKCSGWPMAVADMVAAKKTIEQARKEEEKFATAKDLIASNCLTTNQVTELCNLFKSEKTRLAFAKYAYKFTIDRKNYAAVNKALSLDASRKELTRFINGG